MSAMRLPKLIIMGRDYNARTAMQYPHKWMLIRARTPVVLLAVKRPKNETGMYCAILLVDGNVVRSYVNNMTLVRQLFDIEHWLTTP